MGDMFDARLENGDGRLTRGNRHKSTLEASGEDLKTTLETSGEDLKTTLETSGEHVKLHSKRVENM